uniref:Secreted protein n=1 Tax=Panagrellus redivivus TaxID=6233 RepID=A0A7E4V8Z7_PANRE
MGCCIRTKATIQTFRFVAFVVAGLAAKSGEAVRTIAHWLAFPLDADASIMAFERSTDGIRADVITKSAFTFGTVIAGSTFATVAKVGREGVYTFGT